MRITKTLIIAILVFGGLRVFAARRGSSVNLDAERTVETSFDGSVMHVNITDTSGKTKCQAATFDKGYVVICVEK